MSKDNSNYYQQFDWEKADLAPKLEEKIKKIFANIPEDVKTVIDVGCGDGTISNALSQKYSVCSVDRSENALAHVTTKKICASADKIPVSDNSYDLVFSSQMIEHLPEKIFTAFVAESKRISSRYIMLSFPDDENINKQLIQCPECKTNFNKSYHLRSLNKNKILKLFPEYNLVSEFTTGAKIRNYNKVLSHLKHSLTPPESWIPLYWTTKTGRKSMCPNCETQLEIPYKNNYLARLIDGLNILISAKKPYQLVVLLEKKDV